MSETHQQRIKQIAQRRWVDCEGSEQNFLTDDEVENLNIARGTLTADERTIVNHHIVATIKMLESLPFPRSLQNVSEIAGGHHERMDGKGYPKGLKREELSIPARMMGIVDIFEALTAVDRPYKDGMTLSQAISILEKMKLDQHVDPDLLDLFINEKVYRGYAERYLQAYQLDDG